MTNPQEAFNRLIQNLESVVVGKREAIERALITLLCRGHLLIEDVPGLGKTMLARALAGSLALDCKRIQFTPDLLPFDVTGVSVYNQKLGEFSFQPGPVFTNILLADEINRATPRTQSSLLEGMEEFQVTADGKTYALPRVFMVMATQNPIELQGTYPLPEAQLDRFFMRIQMGYPSIEEEVTVMEMQIKDHPIHSISPVVCESELVSLQQSVADIYLDACVKRYIAELVAQTREHEHLSLGASPRGSLALMRASQAMALMRGMDFVDPQIVKTIAQPVLSHRILVKPQSQLSGITGDKIVSRILDRVSAPVQMV